MRPEPKTRPDSWVPGSEADYRSGLDPISALIFAGDARVCPNTLPIYDGESRMDLVLTPKGTKPFSTDGFEGEAIVCDIRYVPRSGFRRGRSDIEYLKKRSEQHTSELQSLMRISYAVFCLKKKN